MSIVYLYPAADQKVPIHSELRRRSSRRSRNWTTMRADSLRALCLLRTRQTLVIGNSDPIGHNVMIDTQKNPPDERDDSIGRFDQEVV